MRIAVMSDSHDNIANTRKAVAKIRDTGCRTILHCGDLVAPFMLAELEAAKMPVHCVFGNNDGDRHLLTKHALTVHRNITIHGDFGRLEAEGRRIAFMHDGVFADDLAAGGRYDVVCFGHYHVYMQKKIGNTLVLNPGEILGKDGDPGFCVVDTATLFAEQVLL